MNPYNHGPTNATKGYLLIGVVILVVAWVLHFLGVIDLHNLPGRRG